MGAIRTDWTEADRTGATIALLGVALVVGGFALEGVLSVAPVLATVGLGLAVAGVAFAAVDASRTVRLAVTFVALLAVQLVAVGGALRWIGGVAIGSVAVAAAYTRLASE